MPMSHETTHSTHDFLEVTSHTTYLLILTLTHHTLYTLYTTHYNTTRNTYSYSLTPHVLVVLWRTGTGQIKRIQQQQAQEHIRIQIQLVTVTCTHTHTYAERYTLHSPATPTPALRKPAHSQQLWHRHELELDGAGGAGARTI